MLINVLIYQLYAGNCLKLANEDYAVNNETSRNFLYFTSPLGYYNYKKPLLIRFPLHFLLNEKDLEEYKGKNEVNSAVQNKSTPDFDTGCPMFARNKGETCCLHVQAYHDNNSFYSFTQIQSFYDSYQFAIYPRCYNLIRYLPCAMCHPNLDSVVFNLKNVTKDSLALRSFSLCNSYAEKIYFECRNAYYSNYEGKINKIVPEDFSLDDFKKVVRSPDKDDPDKNCVSEKLFSDATFGIKPSRFMLILIAFASFVSLIFN